MDLPDFFSTLAQGFSAAFGGPFHDARIVSHPSVETYSNNVIIPGTGQPVFRTCKAQVDVMNERMRGQVGASDKDQGIFVLSATLDGAISTDDEIEMLAGPFAGLWSIESVGRDPAAVYWELRGRRG